MTPPNCCPKSKGSHYKLVDSNSPIAILKMKPFGKIFWKTCRDNVVVIPDENQEDDADANNFWLKNDLYNLRFDDQKILRSPTVWLNDRIMDAAQKPICKELGLEYQSVLNVQKSGCPPFYPVHNKHENLRYYYYY